MRHSHAPSAHWDQLGVCCLGSPSFTRHCIIFRMNILFSWLSWTESEYSMTPSFVIQCRVEHFPNIEILIFATTSKKLRILMELKVIKNGSDSKLQIFSIFSIRILIILEVIAKTSLSEQTKVVNHNLFYNFHLYLLL